MEHTKDKIKIDIDYVKKNDKVIVAFSGGRDSVFLLENLYHLSKRNGFTLIALHVNHSLRENESIRDMNFCEEYAIKLKIPFIKEIVDAKAYSENNYLSIEEAARILRYKIFEKVYNKYRNKKQNTYVAVAHHKNDQAETVIHNLLRGTGIRGMAGMDKANKFIIRPMLDISREEIDDYIFENNLQYVEDSTNQDIKYTRNYIRNEILPILSNINLKAVDHIADFASQAREITNFIALLVDKIIKDISINPKDIKKEVDLPSNIDMDTLDNRVFAKAKTENCGNYYTGHLDNKLIRDAHKIKVIDNKLFNNITDFIKGEVLREVIKDFTPHLKDVTKENINDIIILSNKDKGGHLDLPYNIIVEKKKKYLIFAVTKKNVSMSRRKKK